MLGYNLCLNSYECIDFSRISLNYLSESLFLDYQHSLHAATDVPKSGMYN